MDSAAPFTTAAAQARLEHLRRLPESPMRRREITSLERMIESGACGRVPQPRKKMPTHRSMTEQDLHDYDERDAFPVPPPTPLREVQRVEGRRRVIIRAAQKIDKDDEVETAAMARERDRRRGDIQAMLGLRFRGMIRGRRGGRISTSEYRMSKLRND